MRVLIAILLTTLLAMAAACGGGDSGAVRTVTVERDPDAAEDQAAPAPIRPGGEDLPDCDEAGMTREGRQEGTCTKDGATWTVVERDSLLRLEEMNVRLVGISFTPTIEALGSVERADGTFAIVRMRVTNKLNHPVTIEPSMFYIGAGGNEYSHDFDAMNNPGDSFVWNSDPVQPGNTRTGTVIFDVSRQAAQKLSEDGNLVVLQFSDANVNTSREAELPIGVIRTYR